VWGGGVQKAGFSVTQSSWVKQAPMRRRDFLALSSVAAGAALLPPFVGAAETLVRNENLSVGYLAGSDQLEDVFQLPWRDLPEGEREDQWVVPAESLVAGDGSLAFSMIDIKLHGLYPAMPPRKLATLSSACLTVFYHLPWLGLTEPLPFYAWGARFGATPTAGSPVRFIAPTREDGSLQMAFDIMPLAKRGALARRAATDFTVDSWAGRPKLQRGIYLLGFESSTFAGERVIPAEPASQAAPWELCSLVMSVDRLEEGAI
jgi:hypothetical protein